MLIQLTQLNDINKIRICVFDPNKQNLEDIERKLEEHGFSIPVSAKETIGTTNEMFFDSEFLQTLFESVESDPYNFLIINPFRPRVFTGSLHIFNSVKIIIKLLSDNILWEDIMELLNKHFTGFKYNFKEKVSSDSFRKKLKDNLENLKIILYLDGTLEEYKDFVEECIYYKKNEKDEELRFLDEMAKLVASGRFYPLLQTNTHKNLAEELKKLVK